MYHNVLFLSEKKLPVSSLTIICKYFKVTCKYCYITYFVETAQALLHYGEVLSFTYITRVPTPTNHILIFSICQENGEVLNNSVECQ